MGKFRNKSYVIKSHFLKPGSYKKMELFENHYLAVDTEGKIRYFGINTESITDYNISELLDKTDCIIIPGLIDLHTHIPQYPAIGLGKGTLLKWLDDYIYPLETKFNNPEYAFILSKLFFEECLKYGTTKVTAYSNSSFDGTDSAFQAAFDSGIRAFIGMSMMDTNVPELLLKSTKKNIDDSLKLAGKWHGAGGDKLKYILTPRYALICSMELMKKTGEVSRKDGFYIQTHLAENIDELKKVAGMFPQCNTYTDVYHQAGMLNERTLLAHCIYLSDYEIELIRSNNANVVHCPSSNRFLKSGIFPFMNISELISVGIGSDVAGGTSLSMLHELKEAVETSKTYQLIHNHHAEILSSGEALWTATKGNAEILGISDFTGDFKTGMDADFATVKLDRIDIEFGNLSIDTITPKLLYLLGNKYVDSTYIKGKLLFGN